jgi:hypothetical protein
MGVTLTPGIGPEVKNIDLLCGGRTGPGIV